VIVAALLLGAFSILETPREEEPQIVVPCLTCSCRCRAHHRKKSRNASVFPWRSCFARFRCRICLLHQPAGHEHADRALLRGSKEEDAIVQTYNKLYSNFDQIPPGVSQPIIKVRSINDVPIMALTLWGKNYDSYHLRRIAANWRTPSNSLTMFLKPR